MENSYQNSTTAQIIDAIINQLSFEGESKSDIADILLSILNQTPYEKEPSSVIAELFIKLKAKIEGESFEPFDKPYISNIAEIIKSILDETEYNNAPNSRIAELLLELKEELENLVDIRPYNEWDITGSFAVLMNSVPNKKLHVSLIDKDTSIDISGISFGFVDSNWDKVSSLTTKQYRWAIQNGIPSVDKSNTSAFSKDIILTGLIFYPKTESTYNKLMARYNYKFEIDTPNMLSSNNDAGLLGIDTENDNQEE